MRLVAVMAAALVAAGLTHAQAWAQAPRTAALRVDGLRLSTPAFEVLQRAARSQDPKASAVDVAVAVVHDHVLGRHARRQFGDARLFDDARVGFSLASSAEASLAATLERVFADQIAAAQSARDDSLVVKAHPLTPDRLTALFGPGTTLKLDDSLTPRQDAAMARVVLAEYRFGHGALQPVSLRDVWHQLDVNGRNLLYNLDVAFAGRHAMRLVRAAFARHVALTQGGLRREDIAALRQLMADRERRVAFEQRMGLHPDAHRPAPELARLQREVSAADVARYWSRHPEQFQRIERVKMRHIRCGDEACARSASEALERGDSFEHVARKWSVAPSRDQGGSLDWIEASRARDAWLLQFGFAQPPGPPSPPVREPEAADGTAGWQIVQVEDRQTGLHPVDSETVRFIAAQALARERAARQFMALRDRLVREARIEVDPGLGIGAQWLREGRPR